MNPTPQLRAIASQVKGSTLVDIAELVAEGESLYELGGLPRGAMPGWPAVDDLWSVQLGQWTVVTGTPQSGKSEWLDALLVNLAEAGDWEFCIYSPENSPTSTHLVKLAEKRTRLPFNRGVSKRMTLQEFRMASRWIAERFFWIDPELKTPLDLIAAGLAFRQRGKNFGIVLDPWNTLDHERKAMNETDYVSLVLTEVTKLARASRAHVFLVVHPQKIQRNRDGVRPIPTPYDLIGSSHWYNKADNIICVNRNQTEGTQDVEIHVQKVRFKHIGHIGVATLKWDKVNGRYFEVRGGGIEGEQYSDPQRGQEPPAPYDSESVAEREALQAE